MDNDSPSPLNTDWLAAQKQYMDALASFTGFSQQNKASSISADSWQKALDFWWQSVMSATPDDVQPVYGHLLQQSRTFYSINTQLEQLLLAMTGANQTGEDWQSVFQNHIEQMKKALGTTGTDNTGRPQAVNNIWQLPLTSWDQNVSAMSGPQAELLKQFNMYEPIIKQFFSAPGMGYTREFQEKIRDGLKHWHEYRNNCVRYQQSLAKVGIKALDKLQDKIFEYARANKTINSLREFYDVWIDCNEDAYAEYVFTDEYAELHGDLVNSLAIFRQHSQQLMDDILALLSMPNQESIMSMQKRQSELRRELTATKIKLEQDGNKISELERELDEIRRTLTSESGKDKKDQ